MFDMRFIHNTTHSTKLVIIYSKWMQPETETPDFKDRWSEEVQTGSVCNWMIVQDILPAAGVTGKWPVGVQDFIVLSGTWSREQGGSLGCCTTYNPNTHCNKTFNQLPLFPIICIKIVFFVFCSGKILKVGTFLKIGIVSGEFIFSLQMFTL